MNYYGISSSLALVLYFWAGFIYLWLTEKNEDED